MIPKLCGKVFEHVSGYTFVTSSTTSAILILLIRRAVKSSEIYWFSISLMTMCEHEQ